MSKLKQIFKLKWAFLIDGIGAAMSALLLLLVIVPFQTFFGFPSDAALKLSVLPLIFSIYSLTCYFTKPSSPVFLKIIAVANILYCLLSLGLVIFYFAQLTVFGLLYFLIEKLIVVPLAVWEWKLSKV